MLSMKKIFSLKMKIYNFIIRMALILLVEVEQ